MAQSITSQETVNNYEDFTINWNIPINETMYRWNKSAEEPVVRVEYSAPGRTGWDCIIFDCTGEFRMYYSNNEDGQAVEANFPIVNATGDGPGDGGDNDDGGLGGAVGDSLPGFGLAAGLGALAMAAIASSRPED